MQEPRAHVFSTALRGSVPILPELQLLPMIRLYSCSLMQSYIRISAWITSTIIFAVTMCIEEPLNSNGEALLVFTGLV